MVEVPDMLSHAEKLESMRNGVLRKLVRLLLLRMIEDENADNNHLYSRSQLVLTVVQLSTSLMLFSLQKRIHPGQLESGYYIKFCLEVFVSIWLQVSFIPLYAVCQNSMV